MEGESVLGFTGDGARLVTSVADGLVVRAFPSGFVLSRIPGLGWGSSPAISPDGALIVSSNHPILGTILVRSLMSGEVVREHRGGEPVVSTLFAAGGQVLYATRRWSGTYQIYDVASGSLLNPEDRVAWDQTVLAAHPDGKLVAVGAGDRDSVAERDAFTGQLRRALTTGVEGTIQQLMYRSDGVLAAIVEEPTDFDGDPTGSFLQPFTTVVWQKNNRKGILQTHNHTYGYEMKWSPTGSLLAMGLPSGFKEPRVDVQLWDGVDKPRSLPGYPDMDLAGLSWSPDGALLAVGYRLRYNNQGQFPGRVQVYDVDSGEQLARLEHVVQPIFAPDGAALIAQGDGILDRAMHVFAAK
ncbi:MAG: WD40 repeat domain-containing protein [Ardenticatenia bacterium]|nr:WD40 repeat domain-containing protein [Ardenticatenia bacterium]